MQPASGYNKSAPAAVKIRRYGSSGKRRKAGFTCGKKSGNSGGK
jgi:hypothetical protein